jgi:hypothetical protein
MKRLVLVLTVIALLAFAAQALGCTVPYDPGMGEC